MMFRSFKCVFKQLSKLAGIDARSTRIRPKLHDGRLVRSTSQTSYARLTGSVFIMPDTEENKRVAKRRKTDTADDNPWWIGKVKEVRAKDVKNVWM